MKRLLRNSKLVLLSAALALGGLAFAATATPAAHAASPSLTATGQGGSVYVYGSGFNPYGGSVRVEVLNSNLTQVLDTEYPLVYPNGSFAVLLKETPSTSYTGIAHVVADQSGLPSTWTSTYIYPAPYITATSGIGDVGVQGSGFAPGTTVTVTVFQWYGCVTGGFIHLCTHVLSTQTVTASSPTYNDAEAGIIYATLPSPSGNVLVEASGTSIVTNSAAYSNAVSLYVS
jgi:hypothetical protein